MKFEAAKGERLHRYFLWVQASQDLWWSHKLKRWVTQDEAIKAGGNYSNSADCKTLKAFKRMLRKNPEIVGSAILVNKYEGFNVFA